MSLSKTDRFFLLVTYGLMLSINLVIQQLTPGLLSLDSWTIYHILESILEHSSLLPRAVLYSYYPGSYALLILPAKLLGIYPALKIVYPIIVSLVVVPLYLFTRQRLKAAPAAAATLTITFISDFIIRSLSITPQGIALVFLFSALYFFQQKKWFWLILFSILTILTHHLTSLVLILFLTASLIQESHHGKEKKNFLKNNRSQIVIIATFLLDWVLVAQLSGKNVVSAFLLLQALPAIITISIIFFLTRHWQKNLLLLLEKIPYREVTIITAGIFLASFAAVLTFTTHSFLSTYGYVSLAFIPLYIFAPIFGLGWLLQKKNKTWLLFFLLINLAFGSVLALRLNCIFDAYRLLPFSLIPLIMAVWQRTPRLGWFFLILSMASLLTHGYAASTTLTYKPEEIAAAEYARHYLEKGTVATDTKMSGLFLGVANMPATFEGSYWLFTQDDLAPWIKTFNEFRFKDYPIRYIIISDYMFESGADISWSTTRQTIDQDNLEAFEKVGDIVYKNELVTIWQINEESWQQAGVLPIETPQQTLSGKILGIWPPSHTQTNEPQEITIQPRTAYGSTCNN